MPIGQDPAEPGTYNAAIGPKAVSIANTYCPNILNLQSDLGYLMATFGRKRTFRA